MGHCQKWIPNFSLMAKSLYVLLKSNNPDPILWKEPDNKAFKALKKGLMGTSLAVQWLRLCASNAGAEVQSLVGKLRSHMPCGAAKKNKKERNCKEKKCLMNPPTLGIPIIRFPSSFWYMKRNGMPLGNSPKKMYHHPPIA